MFKKNTAVTGFMFGLVSKTDGSEVTTGATTGHYSLDGGPQGILTNTPAHLGKGQWAVNLTAAEMNGDIVGLAFGNAAAISTYFTIKTDTKIVSELNDISTTEVRTEVDAGIAAANLATEAKQDTAQADLDTISGTDGATLATAQPNYAPAKVTDVPTATENADALLNRDMGAVTDSNDRSPLNALRFLRNKYSVTGSNLTVTKEDDVTAAWTSVLTTDPNAEPVTGSDPAGP